MIDPSEPLCGPSTCLRAEAEDLRERAQHNADLIDSAPEPLKSDLRTRAAAFTTLANRYERAASMLDEAGEQEAQTNAACPINK